MNYEQAKEKLAGARQEHVLKYYEELTEGQKELLLAQIEATDFSMIASLEGGKHENPRGVITPLEVMQIPQIKERETEFREIGLDAIQKGKWERCFLRGGMGTRFGARMIPRECTISDSPKRYIFSSALSKTFWRW